MRRIRQNSIFSQVTPTFEKIHLLPALTASTCTAAAHLSHTTPIIGSAPSLISAAITATISWGQESAGRSLLICLDRGFLIVVIRALRHLRRFCLVSGTSGAAMGSHSPVQTPLLR